jgi:nicotinate-nucleotide adenylyltransferase
MVSLAIEGRPEYSVDDRELRREGPSYTYTTVAEIIAEAHKKGGSEKFVLILGEDSAHSFHQWYRCDDIVDLVDLAIVGRTGSPTYPYKGSPKVVASLRKGATPMDLVDISSTEVRKRLTRGESCGGLIPVKVLDYIKGHHLYQPLTQKEKEHASN